MNNKYQVMPPLSDEEYELLKQSIKAYGVQVAVEYDEAGNVLDGHQRLNICTELNITEWPRVVREGLTEDEKRAHARRLNLVRRQLTRAQKQVLIREQLKETPEKSDLQIAKELNVSDKTVTTQRAGMVRRSEIPNVATKTDTLGRKQPGQRTRKDGNSATGESGQSTHVKISQPPPPEKGPSEKSIEKDVEAIPAPAVAVANNGDAVNAIDVKQWRDEIKKLKNQHRKKQESLKTKIAILQLDLNNLTDRNAELTRELQALRNPPPESSQPLPIDRFHSVLDDIETGIRFEFKLRSHGKIPDLTELGVIRDRLLRLVSVIEETIHGGDVGEGERVD